MGRIRHTTVKLEACHSSRCILPAKPYRSCGQCTRRHTIRRHRYGRQRESSRHRLIVDKGGIRDGHLVESGSLIGHVYGRTAAGLEVRDIERIAALVQRNGPTPLRGALEEIILYHQMRAVITADIQVAAIVRAGIEGVGAGGWNVDRTLIFEGIVGTPGGRGVRNICQYSCEHGC